MEREILRYVSLEQMPLSTSYLCGRPVLPAESLLAVVNLLPGSRCKSISVWTIHQCDGSRRKSNVYEDECALKLYSPPRANAII